MNRHINFKRLEPGDPVDRGHLAECETCRHRWQLVRFIRMALKAAPEMEAPPFFASRMAALARSSVSPASLLVHLQKAARTLVPIFMVLVIVATSALYLRTDYESAAHYYSEVLFEQPAAREEVSIEFIVTSLLEHSEEE